MLYVLKLRRCHSTKLKKVLAMNTQNDGVFVWFGFIRNLRYLWFNKINRLKHCTKNSDTPKS